MSRKENNDKRSIAGSSLPTVYFIEFNTEDMPGRIIATTVSLGVSFIEKDNQELFQINLSDHQLYAKLCDYVKNNPPKVLRENG